MSRTAVVVLLAAALLTLTASVPAVADVVGYVNINFQPGYSLFCNPLWVHARPDMSNPLSDVFPTAPDGTLVFPWNAATQMWEPGSEFDAAFGGWSIDYDLSPGSGAMLYNQDVSSFTGTFVGEVSNPDGSRPFVDPPPWIAPAPYAGPAGMYLLSCKTPLSLPIADGSVFHFVVGREPVIGEQFFRWDVGLQAYEGTTFTDLGWDNGDPVLGVGEAAFFNLVPEPATLSLLILGLGGLAVRRRRR